MKNFLHAVAGVLVLASLIQAQTPPSSEKVPTLTLAVPVEPIVAILDSFRSNSIVALADFHGNQQIQEFRLSLIRDPRFATTVNDIVVEFGNARYQDLMDRFVRGEDVPYESLRQVWQNTTQIEYEWDLPIYEEFFRAVRSVNASLQGEHQLRVLLGDPPIDWDSVRTAEDLSKWLGQRDRYAVDVIRSEVLAKGRKALVIYGGEHLARKNTVIGAADEWARGLVAQLERPAITSVFTINPETRMDLKTLQPDVTSWPRPSLTMLRGTNLGAAIFEPGPQRRPVRMEEQFDALLYLGPPSAMTIIQLSPPLCSDPAYMEMRLSRLSLVPPPPGAPITPADRLKEYCAHPEGLKVIGDSEPQITELLRETLRDAAVGKVDPVRFAPESREKLTQFLQEIGPQFLGPAGPLESLTLLMDTNDGGQRVRRYRAKFASGESIIWIVGLSSTGAFMSLDPRPE